MISIAGRRIRRSVAAIAVLMLHVVAGWVFLWLQPRLQRAELDDVASVWLMVNAPEPPPDPESVERSAKSAAARQMPRRLGPRNTQPSTAISAPTESAPAINWDRAREGIAQDHADRLLAANPRQFGHVEPSRPFKVCRRPTNSWEWKEEPGKVGLAGGILPYARLGKRCVIGLGFFGCSLDEPPPANGQLLDSMDDPDKPTSSVPSEADCLPDEVATPP